MSVVRLCNMCTTRLPESISKCACGGEAVDYMGPQDGISKGVDENKGPYGAAELGATVGSVLTEGSAFGAIAGHAIGKAIGEAAEKLGDTPIVTFHELPPEPPVRDIGREAVQAIGKSSKKAIERAKGVLSKVKKRLKKSKS